MCQLSQHRFAASNLLNDHHLLIIITNMKTSLVVLGFAFFSAQLNAQGVSINNDGSDPDASAALDVKSTSKGVLAPRMLESERIAISSPATGLLVYQTDGNSGFYYNAGTNASPNWQKLQTQSGTVAFSANSSIQQTFNPNTTTKILFATEEFDESGNFIPATSEFTAPTNGIYHFDAMIVFAVYQGSRYDISIYVNGVRKKNSLLWGNGQYMTLDLSTDLKLVAGDKVDIRFVSTAPANILAGSPEWVWFNGHKVN
jgi:hypothetical protein